MFLSQILVPGGGPAIITRRNREQAWADQGGMSGRGLVAAPGRRSGGQGWKADALARGISHVPDQRVGHVTPGCAMFF